MVFTNNPDENSFFVFVPNKNSLGRLKFSNLYLQKDTFFKIQHEKTKLWLSFEENPVQNKNILEYYPILTKKCKFD